MTPFDGPPTLSTVAARKASKRKSPLPKTLSRSQAADRIGAILVRTWYQREDPELAQVGTVLACLWEALANGGLHDKGFKDFLGRAETLARAQGLMLKEKALAESYDYAVAAVDGFIASGGDPLALADVVDIRLKGRDDTASVKVWIAGVQVEKFIEAAGAELNTSVWLALLRDNRVAARSGRTVVDLAIEASGVPAAVIEKMHEAARGRRRRTRTRDK